MTSEPRNESRAEAAARRRWLGFIVFFFLLQATLWAAAIAFVSHDPSHAVLPNYSERALRWDTEIEVMRRSERLGWTATAVMGPVRRGGPNPIEVRIADREGRPVTGAQVQAFLFHQARASERQDLRFVDSGPGTYRATATIGRSGRWRIEIQATRGEDRFRVEQIQVVGEAG